MTLFTYEQQIAENSKEKEKKCGSPPLNGGANISFRVYFGAQELGRRHVLKSRSYFLLKLPGFAWNWWRESKFNEYDWHLQSSTVISNHRSLLIDSQFQCILFWLSPAPKLSIVLIPGWPDAIYDPKLPPSIASLSALICSSFSLSQLHCGSLSGPWTNPLQMESERERGCRRRRAWAHRRPRNCISVSRNERVTSLSLSLFISLMLWHVLSPLHLTMALWPNSSQKPFLACMVVLHIVFAFVYSLLRPVILRGRKQEWLPTPRGIRNKAPEEFSSVRGKLA